MITGTDEKKYGGICKCKKQKCAFDLLPFHVIEAASTGDTETIQAVLKHYEGYITVLATRKMFDEFEQMHYCVRGRKT